MWSVQGNKELARNIVASTTQTQQWRNLMAIMSEHRDADAYKILEHVVSRSMEAE